MAELRIYGDIVVYPYEDSDVTAQQVDDFIKSLSPTEDLDIYLNSYGGVVSEGLAIYSTIKRHKGPTRVHIDGVACSISSVLAFAGDELIVPDHGIMMIHLPWQFAMVNRLNIDQKKQGLITIENSLTNVYKENLRNSNHVNKLTNLMEEETWLDADDIADLFKVKRVEGGEKKLSTSASTKDRLLAKYGKPGKEATAASGKVSILDRYRQNSPSKNYSKQKFSAWMIDFENRHSALSGIPSQKKRAESERRSGSVLGNLKSSARKKKRSVLSNFNR